MLKPIFITGLLFLLFSLFGQDMAQEEKNQNEEANAIGLEEVVITATRTEENKLDVPVHVTVITAEEIAAAGYKNLSAVLKSESSIVIADYGPEGAQKSASIRGAEAAQVLVLVDGVRAAGSHGGADLSLLPLENVERIEIVRGGAGAVYGADAVGGVINIITKKEAHNDFYIQVENGSYLPDTALRGTGSSEQETAPDFMSLLDTQKINLGGSLRIGGLHLTSRIDLVRAENEFIYHDANHERHIRENAALLGGNAALNIRYAHDNGFINLAGNALYYTHGTPGSITYPTPDAAGQDTKGGCTLQLYFDRFLTDTVMFDLKGFYQYYALDYNPGAGTNSLHANHESGADLTMEISYFDFCSIIAGGNLFYDYMESTDLGQQTRVVLAGFADFPLYLSEQWIIHPGIRYDHYSDFGGSFNFLLGAVYKLSSTLSLKSNLSRSFRAPTFNDLYWPADDFAEGNPQLNPEVGYNFDLGLTFAAEQIDYNLFLFTRYAEDMIIWQAGEDFIYRPANYEKGLYPGIEADIAVDFLEHFQIKTSYTFLYSFALSGAYTFADNRRIPGVPVHTCDISFNFSNATVNGNITLHYDGLNYLNSENTSFLKSVFTVDAGYRQSFNKYLLFFIAVENLFNEEQATVRNYPQPGFYLRTGFEIGLK